VTYIEVNIECNILLSFMNNMLLFDK
jgi:hypothetical protein